MFVNFRCSVRIINKVIVEYVRHLLFITDDSIFALLVKYRWLACFSVNALKVDLHSRIHVDCPPQFS